MSTGLPQGLLCGLLLLCAAPLATGAEKRLLWGDTHLHSAYSADSYLHGNFTIGPEEAYRFARGEPVAHPYHGARVQLSAPLDFLVVSDHAEFLGGIRTLHRGGYTDDELGVFDRLIVWGTGQMFRFLLRDGQGMDRFRGFSAQAGDPRERAAEFVREGTPTIPGQAGMITAAWRELALAADAFNAPGEFSALIGWEWTSMPGGANLHRVVITDGDAASAATYLPYSRDDSPYPEDLWRWLAQTSERTGDDFVAIPHNSNISKGYMFPLETLRGAPFDEDYLRLRSRWEPVVEATQIKGDSETHPALSPADAFADFERYTHYIQAQPTPYQPRPGDFVRSALRRGLEIGASTGINPYRLGMIGSTDSHTGLASAEEDNFHGKMAHDSIPANKAAGIEGEGSASGWDMSASGLAAVWATDNTREAILAALRRREVYATTGPRIAVRFEGGWQEAGGVRVPMGAALPAPTGHGAPVFEVSALRDPRGANLDRIQIVKGWLDAGGHSHERVIDVVWSQPRRTGPGGEPRPIADTVDPATARAGPDTGSASLEARWRDPDFDPTRPAFYYARVLQVPTPRHSLYDAVALGLTEIGKPTSLQERAYTSPIWYEPSAAPP